MKREKCLVWIGLAAALALVGWLELAMSAAGSEPAAPVSRTMEPVIVSGEQLPAVQGAAIDDLFVYAFDGSTWAAIPFQIDEVTASGVYTVEDGLLDANDEVVFMAMDLGVQASAQEWLTDTASQTYPRYELAVTNPLEPAEQGWAYLYRSPTLSPVPPRDYVDWDEGRNRLVAEAYVLGLAPASHAGMDSLELNGSGVDALDRSKIRIDATCYIGGFPIPIALTEDDLASQMDQTPHVDGPVRVGGGNAQGSSWAYAALDRSRLVFDVAGIEPPPPCTSLVLNRIRLSTDWREPGVGGMAPATYYDANTPGGVAVDGVPDPVPAAPASGWRQVSGAQGSVVNVLNVGQGVETLSNYYRDDQAVDPGDTGDQRSYGDAGVVADDLSGLVVVDMLAYVLDPLQPNMGQQFLAYYDEPLDVTAIRQHYPPSGPMWHVYLPLVSKEQ